MDDDLYVEYVEMRLDGQAKIFWENESYAAHYKDYRPHERQPITSWVDMTSRLRNKYVPRQYDSMLFLSWLDLRHGKMPV
ncbi:unnamed protein product [Spirodela intermedia]|uniref:Uncharacterized protein n=1 Tax=Spirodela intermedia TaxID=51605 RepID=A0A7I8KMV0_SPIIN|nr:unnamed protein product [Spirodela intermedia]